MWTNPNGSLVTRKLFMSHGNSICAYKPEHLRRLIGAFVLLLNRYLYLPIVCYNLDCFCKLADLALPDKPSS